MKLALRRPEKKDEDAFWKTVHAPRVFDPHFAHGFMLGMPFSKWLELLNNQERGLDLPEGHVPSTLLLGFVSGEIVGRLSIRHQLNEALLKVGGHIGYVVLPEFQRKGYAKEMLSQALLITKKMNLDRVLLTCDQGNIGSQKTIEHCGGQLENIVAVPGSEIPKMRFWIQLK